MLSPNITQTKLKELLAYNPETGVFTWKVTRGKAKSGSIAQTKGPHGYLTARVSQKSYLLHRLAWLYMYGCFPEGEIDHINGVRHDNRIANLRCVTRDEQMQNIAVKRTSTTGVLGVSPHKISGKYRARIWVDGQRRNLGLFETVEEASAAYLSVKAEHHTIQPTPRHR